jgi:hypothetical protein
MPVPLLSLQQARRQPGRRSKVGSEGKRQSRGPHQADLREPCSAGLAHEALLPMIGARQGRARVFRCGFRLMAG